MLDHDTVTRIAETCYPTETYDNEVFSPGFRDPILARGFLMMPEFIRIVQWKSRRSKGCASRNSPGGVRACTRRAFAASRPREAAAELCHLHGVQVRMASALLTVHDPETYTIMDVRAWASLCSIGLESVGLSEVMDPWRLWVYEPYLEACRSLADEHGVSLRTLDRCLFALAGQTPEECLAARQEAIRRCR